MVEEINIIVVDDQKLFREGISSLMKDFNINVVAEAENGLQLLKLLKTITPDAVLLDLEMDGLDGNETFDRVQEEFPGTKIIIVTMYDDEVLIKDFFNRGACAFLTKDSSGEEMDKAIRSVKSTGQYKGNLPALELKRIRSAKKYYYELIYTRREREIICLLCKSKTTTEIALELNISEKTIETNLTEIYKKTKVKSRPEFIKHAFKEGLNYLGTFPASQI